MSSRTRITSFPSNLCLGLFPVFPTDFAGILTIIAVTSQSCTFVVASVFMLILILMKVTEIYLLD